MMLKVALTGGIATGKTIVGKILKDLGCYILNADELAHTVYEPGQEIWKKLVEHFGKQILNKDSSINRAKLGKIIFSNKKEREYLNKLIHPKVAEKEMEIFNKVDKEGKYNIFVTEAALIIEAGMTSNFDKIIVAYCKKETQIKRLMDRDKITKKEALSKIKSQFPVVEKLKFADYIIDTSGTLRETIEQTERIYRLLLEDYNLKKRRN